MFALGAIAVGVLMPLHRALLGRRADGINAALVLTWNRVVCKILNLHLRRRGQPDPAARFLVANHVSWLDIIALGGLQHCVFVAKAEVADWPVLGFLARGIGTLFIRRGDTVQATAVAEQMLWCLRRGDRLLLFPEGTTTPGDRVLRFHGKLYQPAERAGVIVQAIALRYTGPGRDRVPFIGDDEFLPHLLAVLRLPRIDLELHFLPALPAGLDRHAMVALTRRQILDVVMPETGGCAAGRSEAAGAT